MASTSLKSTRLQMRWNVQYSTKDQFRFLDTDWYLYFKISGMSFGLSLTNASRGVQYYPQIAPQEIFTVEVHLESEVSGRILPTLTQKTCVTGGSISGPIWQRTEQELLQASPEFQAKILQLRENLPTNNGLIFILVLKTEDDSPKIKELSSNSVSCLESLSKDFSKLLDQGSNPDVEFQCAGRSTKAHGTVVSARSEVIASMLDSDMIEGKTRVGKIPDMEPDIFEKFLRYLYSGKLEELTFEVALRLFEAGDQYAVTGLAKRCSEYLVEHLSVQNACEVLVVADAHSHEGLVEKVVDYMVEQRVPLASEVWPEFCNEHARLATKVLNHGWKVLLK